MIFSGSAVVDLHNSGGLCQPDGADPSCLVAIYTGHGLGKQTQNLAYSNDRGRSWTKYRGNPVLDLGLKEFRDPKVFWHEPTHRWIMVAVLADQHKVRLFGSRDLVHFSSSTSITAASRAGRPLSTSSERSTGRGSSARSQPVRRFGRTTARTSTPANRSRIFRPPTAVESGSGGSVTGSTPTRSRQSGGAGGSRFLASFPSLGSQKAFDSCRRRWRN